MLSVTACKTCGDDIKQRKQNAETTESRKTVIPTQRNISQDTLGLSLPV